MAGTLLHISIADRIAQKLPHNVYELLIEHRDDYHTGAIIPDLPYYDQFFFSAVSTILGRPIKFNTFGTVIHIKSPRNLLFALIDMANSPQKQAFALGALTHFAVDVVFHKEIEKMVIAKADGTSSLDSVHKEIEDQIDLHCHYHLHNHSGVGVSYSRMELNLKPHSDWVKLAEGAFLKTHGVSPSKTKLRRWLNNLKLFGIQASIRQLPWIKVLPKDDPALSRRSIELLDESIDLGAKFLVDAQNYINGQIDLEELKKKIPNLSMANGRTIL